MSWKQRWQAVAVSALVGGSAYAANTLPTVNLDRFNFNPSANSNLLLEGGELNAAGTFRFSVEGELVGDARINRGGGTTDYRIGRRLAHFSAAYSPTSWFQLGFEMPFVLSQSGADALRTAGYNTPIGNGTSNPLLSARVGLLSQANHAPLNLALELKAGLPVGTSEALAREKHSQIIPTLSASHDFGSLRLDGQVGETFRATQSFSALDANPDDTVGSEFNVGAGVSGMLPVEGLRGELSVNFAIATSGASAVTVQPFAGLRYALDRQGTQVFLGGGPAFGNLIGTPNFLLLAGMAFGGGANHSQAVAEQQPAPAPVAQVVCEKSAPHEVTQCPNLDDDGDGIANGADKCPFNYGTGVDGCVVKEAPKQVAIVIDTDHDGVSDTEDKCPAAAGPKENAGCPVGTNSVEPAKPVVADADGDGIADDQDTCPTLKGPADNHGCPADQKQQVVITNDHIQILDKVYFSSGGARIQKKSFRLLDQVAEVILNHPNIPAVEVSGHTDNRGSAAKNTKLSQARADAVRNYLLSKSVPADKLVAKGYGADKPIDTNLTAAGREANRRVEFNFTNSQTVTTQNIPVKAPAPKHHKKGKTESAKGHSGSANKAATDKDATKK